MKNQKGIEINININKDDKNPGIEFVRSDDWAIRLYMVPKKQEIICYYGPGPKSSKDRQRFSIKPSRNGIIIKTFGNAGEGIIIE